MELTTTCTHCGPVSIGATNLRIEGSAATGVSYRFDCPTCHHPNRRRATTAVENFLKAIGVPTDGDSPASARAGLAMEVDQYVRLLEKIDPTPDRRDLPPFTHQEVRWFIQTLWLRDTFPAEMVWAHHGA